MSGAVATAPRLIASLTCEASVARLYPPTYSTGSEDSDKLYDALIKRGAMSRSEIHRFFGGHITDSRLDDAIGILTEKGFVEELVESTAGRQRRVARRSESGGHVDLSAIRHRRNAAAMVMTPAALLSREPTYPLTRPLNARSSID